MTSPRNRRGRAFTLVEIMIVVAIVALLSLLAVVAIGRIKDRAARSMVDNTLRQIYQAKEFYFSETGAAAQVQVIELSKRGYLKKALFGTFAHRDSLETKMGWHYNIEYKAGEPIYAHRYTNPNGTGTILDTIWYPGPPASTAAKP